MDTGQPDAAHQCHRPSRCLVDANTGKARGVAFIDTETGSYDAEAKVVVRRGLDARIGAAAAALEDRAAPERHRQLERPRRPQLLRARDGAERARPRQGGHRSQAHATTMAGRAASTCRASATLTDRRRTSSAATASKGQRTRRCFPGRARHAGIRAGVQEEGARPRRRLHQHGRLRRGAAALREPGRSRSRGEGQLGHPGAALQLQVRRQREEDGRDMAASAGDVRAAGLRDQPASTAIR